MSKTGVTVYSWGADPLHGQSGVTHHAGILVHGGNVGHASVLLTIPNTPENLALVKEKLGREYVPGTDPNHVPWLQRKYVTPSIDMSKKDAKPDYANPAFQEDVIEVYFSWWPEDEKGFGFQTFGQDTMAERTGVGFEWGQKWKDLIHPEERRQTNGLMPLIMNKTILLHSSLMIHESATTPEQLAVLKAYQQTTLLEAVQKSINVLQEKIKKRVDDGSQAKLSGTEKNLITEFLPEFDLTQPIDFNELLEKVTEKQVQIQGEHTSSYYEYLNTAIALMPPEDKTLTAAQRNFYDAIDRLRQLERQIHNVDLATASDESIKDLANTIRTFMIKKPNMFSSADNSLLLKHYQELYPDFPNNLTRESLIAFKEDIALDITPGESGLSNNGASVIADFGLDPASMHDLIHKGNFQKISELATQLQTIASLKPLVEAALIANDANTLSSEMLTEIQNKLANVKEFQKRFPPGKPLQAEELKFLLELINDAPKKTSSLPKQLNAVTQSPGFSSGRPSSLGMLNTQYINPLIDRAVSTGLPPDVRVNLPLKRDADPANLVTSLPGLDPKAMIEQMATMVKEAKAFNIVDNNCSVATTTILAAGAKDANGREAEFKQAEIGNSVINPTTVYQSASKYSDTLKNPMYRPPAQTYYQAAEQYVAQTAINRLAQGGLMNYGIAAAGALTWVGLATLAAPARYFYPGQQPGQPATQAQPPAAGALQQQPSTEAQLQEPTAAPLEKAARARAVTFSNRGGSTPPLRNTSDPKPTVQPQDRSKFKNN